AAERAPPVPAGALRCRRGARRRAGDAREAARCGARAARSLALGSPRAVQAVRGVLAREEHAVLRAFVARAMDLAGRHVEHVSGPAALPLAVELHFQFTFEDEDPLLVR